MICDYFKLLHMVWKKAPPAPKKERKKTFSVFYVFCRIKKCWNEACVWALMDDGQIKTGSCSVYKHRVLYISDEQLTHTQSV